MAQPGGTAIRNRASDVDRSPPLVDIKPVLLVGLTVLVAATALTIVVLRSDGGPIAGDLRIATEIQRLDIRDFTQSSRNMNNYEATALAGTVAAISFWFAGRRQQACVIVIGLVVLLAFTLFLKELVDRPRPDPALIDVAYMGRSPSFPSGHVISSTTLFGYLLYFVAGTHIRRELKWVATLAFTMLAFTNGLGTIHSGAHWPTDTLGGYLWAAVLVAGLICLDRAITHYRGRDAPRPGPSS